MTRPHYRRNEAPPLTLPAWPPHPLAELQHAGRAIPSSGGDQARDRLLDAPGQRQAAALALERDQCLRVTEVADQWHALGVSLCGELQTASERVATLEEVGEPPRRLVAAPGLHEAVEVRLDPPPAIRSLAPVEELLASLERPQQVGGGDDPLRGQLKPPARDHMLCETCEPMAFGLRLLSGAADVVTHASAARSRTARRLQNLTDPD